MFRLPDGFTQLLNLTQLYVNDAFLEFLPASFGRWVGAGGGALHAAVVGL